MAKFRTKWRPVLGYENFSANGKVEVQKSHTNSVNLVYNSTFHIQSLDFEHLNAKP